MHDPLRVFVKVVSRRAQKELEGLVGSRLTLFFNTNDTKKTAYAIPTERLREARGIKGISKAHEQDLIKWLREMV